MKDNKFDIGTEVWFFESDENGQKRLFNGYIIDWWIAAGRVDYDYTLLITQNGRAEKSESQIYSTRDDAANAMQEK